MKFIKISIIGFLIVLFVNNSFANGIENIYLGMSKYQVKVLESLKLVYEDNNLLKFKDNSKEMKEYYFINNKLISILYAYKSCGIEENNSIISVYEVIKYFFNKKYGKPNQNEIIWKNNLYKDDPYKLGLAISLGYCDYYTEWEINSIMRIKLLLTGENGEIVYCLKLTYY